MVANGKPGSGLNANRMVALAPGEVRVKRRKTVGEWASLNWK